MEHDQDDRRRVFGGRLTDPVTPFTARSDSTHASGWLDIS